jgi:hypothetical protein
MTLSRIQELERLDFEWKYRGVTWENRLRELADYRKIHGHCNVRMKHSKNKQLGAWVNTQRTNYRLHFLEGKTSPKMTTVRIKALEGIGFEWNSHGSAWEDHIRELADYRKTHGHCNVGAITRRT